jgi:predicted nucleotidyltransferase
MWQHGRAMASETAILDPGLAERERVVRLLRAHQDALHLLGVSHLWLFGSLARGVAGAESDVDVMIAIPRGRKFSLFDLGEVRVELCELLGREVDAVIEEDLVPEFRRDISPDLVQVF